MKWKEGQIKKHLIKELILYYSILLVQNCSVSANSAEYYLLDSIYQYYWSNNRERKKLINVHLTSSVGHNLFRSSTLF